MHILFYWIYYYQFLCNIWWQVTYIALWIELSVLYCTAL